MFTINRQHLKNSQLNVEIKKTTKFVKVRNINNSFHNNFEYVFMNFYIRKQLFNESKTIVYFKHEIHIVDNFCAKMLLKTNIFDL